MTDNKTVAPFGLWRSHHNLREMMSAPSAPMYPFRHRGRLHYLEALADEGGRVALMRNDATATRCLTPPPFSIRTRVNEYGGKCFCIAGDEIIFNNDCDGRLYRQSLTGAVPTAVTPPVDNANYADLVALTNSNLIVAVMERDARAQLVAVKLSGGAPVTLADGADFYASPAVSPDGTTLAWMEWDNPFMPWDQSRLLRADLVDGGLKIRNRHALVDRAEQAVGQVGFLDDERLLFVSDADDNNFWNFYLAHGDALMKIKKITDDEYEYGEAHWQFGQRRWQALGDDAVVAVGTHPGGDDLVTVDVAAGVGETRVTGFALCEHLCLDDGEVLFVARHADRVTEVRAFTDTGDGRVLHARGGRVYASAPQAIDYPTRDGERAFAYFYAPFNPCHRAPDGDMPPLLVMVHGGPTGRATPEWNALKQYFASLGFAVLDINHRGSTGHGRAYRQRLLGEWGEIDATDIADGVRYVADKSLADPNLVFIRGGSAGGYAVLRALTRFPETFCAGACYYGIGNLITLAKMTHKFEGYYTDRLIGERFDADKTYAAGDDSRFVERSPVFALNRLQCPLILFQGLEDKVVPPALSREVVAALKQKGVRHEYIEYPDEGHGFRRVANRIDSLQRESEFFASVIRAKRDR